MTADEVKGGALKAGAAWAGVGFSSLGIHTWSDVAAVLAVIYTVILIGEWVWKRVKRRRDE